MNTDATMLGENLVGVGLIFRDAQGRGVLAAVHMYEARWSVALAEAMAARFGVVLAQQYGCTHVELECDAYNMSKAISLKNVRRSPFDLVVEDTCMLGSSFIIFNDSHVFFFFFFDGKTHTTIIHHLSNPPKYKIEFL